MTPEHAPESTLDGEVSALRARLAEVERENTLLTERLTSGSSALGPLHKELILSVAELRKRVAELEAENRDFADSFVQVQEQNSAILSLYVASQRLHATLDPDEVMKIVSEILIEMVGAEEFGVLLMEDRRRELRLIADEGVAKYLPGEPAALGASVLGDIAQEGKAFFLERGVPREGTTPLAAIPIKIEGYTLGLLVIYKLLGHKSGFSPVDHQILDLLGAHAATALVSARLHKTMNRKLKTIEGFMALIKKS